MLFSIVNILTDMKHLSDLKNAVSRFEESLHQPKTDITRDSSVLRFELSYEMAWKTMRDYLKSQGSLYNTPKETIRAAFKANLIDYDEDWITMVNDRNVAAHLYAEPIADNLYQKLPKYLQLFKKLIEKAELKLKEQS